MNDSPLRISAGGDLVGPNRDESSNKVIHVLGFRQRNRRRRHRIGRWRRDERTGRNIPGDYDTGTDHSAFADTQRLAGGRRHDDVRADIRVSLDDDSTGSASVRQQNDADANLDAVVYLDSLRVFVLQIYVVADEDTAADLHSAEAVQKWPDTRAAWKLARREMQRAIPDPPCQTFQHADCVTRMCSGAGVSSPTSSTNVPSLCLWKIGCSSNHLRHGAFFFVGTQLARRRAAPAARAFIATMLMMASSTRRPIARQLRRKSTSSAQLPSTARLATPHRP